MEGGTGKTGENFGQNVIYERKEKRIYMKELRR